VARAGAGDASDTGGVEQLPPDDVTDAPSAHPGATGVGAGASRRRTGRRRLLVAGGVALAAVVAFLAVTALTGLPAPGALRRHSYAQLAELRDRVNDEAGEIRTPDDCWRNLYGNDGPLRSIADVDLVRSRVVVRVYSGNMGRVDPWTHNDVVRRLDDLVASDPDLSWGMLELEDSPDGWSPLVSCRLVTRGYLPR
jgi:hypothetical protein